MPSKDEKCEKHRVLSISASTWLKKVDDSCRAASQPISLFLIVFPCFWQAVDTAPCEGVSNFAIAFFPHLPGEGCEILC